MPTRKWWKKAEIYKQFAPPGDWDFSKKAAEDMFHFESTGKGRLEIDLWHKTNINGFALGKKWMDVTITMWREDIPQGLCFPQELDEIFPAEWLYSVLGNIYFYWRPKEERLRIMAELGIDPNSFYIMPKRTGRK